ncbi:hypothetical protein UFOVP29_384 [uncultured Caudovirales phage]|uniref:Uncharacterized protein n=1 Tax=uncultured Caudovirales phage TaxID=2100421 RepID=A0A6J5KPI9_9CAUD|nr:hypothetical protein UFOVP29_384 [uncultured Caudovirales phage]
MDLTALHEFQKQYRTARDHNSKELRLTIAQAERLSLGVSEITMELAQLQADLLKAQSQLIDAVSNPKIDWSGGKF